MSTAGEGAFLGATQASAHVGAAGGLDAAEAVVVGADEQLFLHLRHRHAIPLGVLLAQVTSYDAVVARHPVADQAQPTRFGFGGVGPSGLAFGLLFAFGLLAQRLEGAEVGA